MVALALITAGLVASSERKPEAAPAGPRIVEGVVVGKLYDLKKYEECRKNDPRNSGCNVYRLKRVGNPEYWPYPDVPHVKWPDPPRGSVYRKGMSGFEYWQALCKAEAGEFIYRVVEDVEGLYMIRPRNEEPEHADYDRWVREDPYGYGDRDERWDSFRQLTGPTNLPEAQSKYTTYFAYLYLERPIQEHPIHSRDKKKWHPSIVQNPPTGAKYALYYGNDHKNKKSIRVRYSDRLVGRYGYTWRGISRPHDRELGLAGGELIVVDLKTNEVLGMRRGFRLGPPDPQRGLDIVWWGQVCPRYPEIPDYRNVLWFLTRVAKPKIAKEYAPTGSESGG